MKDESLWLLIKICASQKW